MQKVKNILLSMNFTVLVFVLIGLRVTIMGASIGDALVIAAICGLQGLNRYLETIKTNDINEKLAQELSEIKSHMSGLMIKNSVRPTAPTTEAPVMKKFF
jgi:hypothetical protein